MLKTTLVLVEELFFKVLAVPLPCSDQIVEPAIAADLIQRRQRSEFYSSTTSFLAIRKHDAGESKHVLRIVNINDKYSMYTYPVDPNQFFSQCRLEVRWRFGYSFNAVCCWSLFGEAGDVALTMDAWMFYLLQKRRKILLLDSHNHLAKVLEEMSFDVSKLLIKEDYIEVMFGQQRMQLYIVAGVKNDTAFGPLTKKEISTIAHKILTGRRPLMHTLHQKNGLSGSTSQSESEFDPFGAGHGCNSVSAELGWTCCRV